MPSQRLCCWLFEELPPLCQKAEQTSQGQRSPLSHRSYHPCSYLCVYCSKVKVSTDKEKVAQNQAGFEISFKHVLNNIQINIKVIIWLSHPAHMGSQSTHLSVWDHWEQIVPLHIKPLHPKTTIKFSQLHEQYLNKQ